MAVRTKQEIIDQTKTLFGDTLNDNQLSFLEDITDTITDFEGRTNGEDWKAKYEENDKMWRDKYTARFYSPEPEQEQSSLTQPGPEPDEPQGPATFEELFKEV